MANPKIEVEIGAVIDGLRKGFGESVKIIETLEKQALDLDKALRAATDLPTIQGLNTQLLQTKAAISQLKSSGIDPLTKATSNYNSVGVDFARIIQDAPFGIIGVGNNITQLAGSFQVLKNQTGSTGAALKSALGSILSSGNALILGISILTTVFTILQQNGFFKTEEAAKSLRERLDEFKESLDGVRKATLEGQIAAQKEISTYKLLQVQAENTSLSQEKRNQAVSQLQKQYPEYLKGLTEEQIKTGQVGEAYNKLTNDIVALSKAKAFSAQIDKNTADSLTLLLQEEERAILISQKRQDQERARREDEQRRAFGTAGGAAGAAAISEAASIENEINSLIQETVKSSQERVRLSKEIIRLEAGIVDFSSQGANFVKQTGTAIDENKEKLDKYNKGWEKFNNELRFSDELTLLLSENAKKLEKEVDGIFEKRVKEIQLTFKPASEGLDLDKLAQSIQITPEIADIDNSKKTKFILALKDFNAEASNIITNGAVNGLGDIGFAIGEALATGGNVAKAAGKALLGGIATIAEQLGQAAIKVGVGMISIKMAFKNPATAIAAGVALIALAGFIRAKIGGGGGGGITSGIGGGGGGGASVGSSGVGGGSSFVGGGAQGGMFAQNRDLNGELVVRGQDLVYVFGQANDRINKG